MSEEFPLITTKQYQVEAAKWLSAVSRKENVSVLFFPKTDRHIRLGQLLNDRSFMRSVLGSKMLYVFQTFDIDAHDVEDMEDLHFHITEHLNLAKISAAPMRFDQWMSYLQRQGVTFVLILPEAEKYLTNDNKTVLTLLTNLVNEQSGLIHVLSLFETDITHTSSLSLLPSSARLYENIFHYPLYPEDITHSFIAILEKQWGLDVPNKTKNDIVSQCGGHFWLVKDAVRSIATTGSWSPKSESMLFRLRSVYNLLLPSEQSALQKLALSKNEFSTEEELSLSYLRKMRVLDTHNRCLVRLFNDFILNSEVPAVGITLNGDSILINQVPVEKFFSRQEYRVIKFLLEQKNKLVTRDEIAKRIWTANTEEHYSDWAIDQLIARIRKRLAELSFSPKQVQTVRGKGYRLNLPAST